jgi:hypothetical protein
MRFLMLTALCFAALNSSAQEVTREDEKEPGKLDTHGYIPLGKHIISMGVHVYKIDPVQELVST